MSSVNAILISEKKSSFHALYKYIKSFKELTIYEAMKLSAFFLAD